jgi:hypothetical protein
LTASDEGWRVVAEWTDQDYRELTATAMVQNLAARRVTAQRDAAVRAVQDLCVHLGEQHQPMTVQTLLGEADACSCCTDDEGHPVLYPCRTMRLVTDYRRHMVTLTDGKVTRRG